MSIREGLKQAFTIPEEEKKLTSEEEELLNKIAKGVTDRKLEPIAIAFLESVKYLNFIGSQTMLFFKPIVQSIFPTKTYGKIQEVLEKRISIEYLITAIERKS
ncbi:hypothetical protein KAW65_06340 [candidate division WOR-3 bacterium]|nr:hypothetical protein [candidate division WOR-3 bacterium]